MKLMINETKNTSANEWRFDEGCEKSPSTVILAFLCFENKNILSFSYTKEKNYSNRFEF